MREITYYSEGFIVTYSGTIDKIRTTSRFIGEFGEFDEYPYHIRYIEWTAYYHGWIPAIEITPL